MSEQQFNLNFEDLQKQQTQSLFKDQQFNQIIFTPYAQPVNHQEIKESNLRKISGVIKQNVKKCIEEKDNWNFDHFQESCQEVIQYFMKNEKLLKFRGMIQGSIKHDEELFVPNSIRNLDKLTSTKIVVGKPNQAIFQIVSNSINKDILFFYNTQTDRLNIKNAKYSTNALNTNIQSLQILKNNQKYSFQEAVWFKDRKGDIFAFNDGVLSVFKYHLKEQKMKQIQLRKDKAFQSVKQSGSIVYVPQNDKVYYFSQNCQQQSFFVELYRPERSQKDFSNCVLVNCPVKIKIQEQMMIKRVTYMLQMIEDNQIPVIYLICFKKNYRPVPLLVLKLIQNQKGQAQTQEIHSTQDEFDEQQINIDLTEANLSVFKKGTSQILCLYCKINDLRSFLQGKIVKKKNRLQMEWKIHPIQLLHKINSKKSSFQSYFSREIRYRNVQNPLKNRGIILLTQKMNQS